MDTILKRLSAALALLLGDKLPFAAVLRQQRQRDRLALVLPVKNQRVVPPVPGQIRSHDGGTVAAALGVFQREAAETLGQLLLYAPVLPRRVRRTHQLSVPPEKLRVAAAQQQHHKQRRHDFRYYGSLHAIQPSAILSAFLLNECFILYHNT